MRLDLPRARSLIHRPRPLHATVALDDIEAIETRLEAYSSLGMTNMQRIVALKLRSGELIILGEDRALNTGLASSVLAKAVAQIVRSGGVEVRDLGMVEGRGGFLVVFFTSAPPWDTPSLGPERQKALWDAAGMTGALAAWLPFSMPE